jgi:hypothetical protein
LRAELGVKDMSLGAGEISRGATDTLGVRTQKKDLSISLVLDIRFAGADETFKWC